jgi:hypothetical protein
MTMPPTVKRSVRFWLLWIALHKGRYVELDYA